MLRPRTLWSPPYCNALALDGSRGHDRNRRGCSTFLGPHFANSVPGCELMLPFIVWLSFKQVRMKEGQDIQVTGSHHPGRLSYWYRCENIVLIIIPFQARGIL